MKQSLLKLCLSLAAVMLAGLNVSAQTYFTPTMPETSEDYKDIKFYLAVSGYDASNKQSTVSLTVFDHAKDYDFEVNLPVSGSKVDPTGATIESLMHDVFSLDVSSTECHKNTKAFTTGVTGVSPQILGIAADFPQAQRVWLSHCYTFNGATLPVKVIDYNHQAAANYPEEYNFKYVITRTTATDGSVKILGQAQTLTGETGTPAIADAHNAWYLITKGFNNNHVTATHNIENPGSRIVLPSGSYVQLGNEKLPIATTANMGNGIFDISALKKLLNENTIESVEDAEHKAIFYLPAGTTMTIGHSQAVLNEAAKITLDLTGYTPTGVISLNGALSYMKQESDKGNYYLLQALLDMFDNLVYMVDEATSPNITVQFGEPEQYIQVYYADEEGNKIKKDGLMSHPEFAEFLKDYPNALGYVEGENVTREHVAECKAAGVKNIVIESVDVLENKTYASPNLVLIDRDFNNYKTVNFYSPQNFRASKLSYTRANTNNYNSVCLPFELLASDNIGNYYIFEHYVPKDATQKYTRQVYFAEKSTMTAGTPCVVYSEAEEWNIVRTTPTDIVNTTTTSNMIGKFIDEQIGTGHYKLDPNGLKYVATTANSTCFAFRCYLDYVDEEAGTTTSSNILTMMSEVHTIYPIWGGEDPATAISNVPTNDNTIKEIYNVNGAKLNTLQKGVNIVKMANGSIRKIYK